MAIEEANPALKGKLGFFPIPGKTADKPGAVFTGGSDLVIPEASLHQAQAYEVVKALAGEAFQTRHGQGDELRAQQGLPRRGPDGNEAAAAMAAGAANGHATPTRPNWAAVEAKNPIKQYMTKFLTGADAAGRRGAASEADHQAILNTASPDRPPVRRLHHLGGVCCVPGARRTPGHPAAPPAPRRRRPPPRPPRRFRPAASGRTC